MKIKIYTIPTCPNSEQAMKFFKKRKLEFEELTLFKEKERRLEIIEKTGQLFTPTIEINGEFVIGFDEEKVKELLKKNK